MYNLLLGLFRSGWRCWSIAVCTRLSGVRTAVCGVFLDLRGHRRLHSSMARQRSLHHWLRVLPSVTAASRQLPL